MARIPATDARTDQTNNAGTADPASEVGNSVGEWVVFFIIVGVKVGLSDV
jgi:hypothetical protein